MSADQSADVVDVSHAFELTPSFISVSFTPDSVPVYEASSLVAQAYFHQSSNLAVKTAALACHLNAAD